MVSILFFEIPLLRSMPESYLHRTQMHYTSARQTWVRRGKYNFWYLFSSLPKSFPVVASEQISSCLCCPLTMLFYADRVWTFWLAVPRWPLSPLSDHSKMWAEGKQATQILDHFREKKLESDKLCMCTACWVLQVFVIGGPRLTLLTLKLRSEPGLQPLTSSDSGKCSCGESSPKEANDVSFLITIFTLTNLFNWARTFQEGLEHISNQLTELKPRNAVWVITLSAFMLLLM